MEILSKHLTGHLTTGNNWDAGTLVTGALVKTGTLVSGAPISSWEVQK